MFYKALEGVKVIEYGNFVSAPFCSKIFADLGADVIKIEEPSYGDEARSSAPFLGNIPGLDRSGLFLYLNMNKLGITLNLRKNKGKQILDELLKHTNIFVENNPPQKMEELGFSFKHLKQINPSIIMTSITPFGQTGIYSEYKSCELLIAHMGGAGYASLRDANIWQEPLKLPAHVFEFQAGLSAAAATMGELYQQRLTGSGEHIDVSEQESVVQNLGPQLSRYCYEKQIVSRTDRLDRAPYHILPCKNGYIAHAFSTERQWRLFLEVMGNPDWGDNELFKDSKSRAEYWDSLKLLILEWTMEHTVDEIYRLSQERGAPIGAVYTAEDVVNSRQLEARDFIAEIQHPKSGKLKYPGVPYRFSDIPKGILSAAPLLGQHNEEIYCKRLGYNKDDLAKLQESGII